MIFSQVLLNSQQLLLPLNSIPCILNIFRVQRQRLWRSQFNLRADKIDRSRIFDRIGSNGWDVQAWLFVAPFQWEGSYLGRGSPSIVINWYQMRGLSAYCSAQRVPISVFLVMVRTHWGYVGFPLLGCNLNWEKQNLRVCLLLWIVWFCDYCVIIV